MQKGPAASERKPIMPRTLGTAPVDIFAPVQSTWRIQPRGLKGSHVRTVMFASQPCTDVSPSLIYQTFISMSDLPEQTTAGSSNHTYALAGPNLSQRQLSQLGRAENRIALASTDQSSQGTDQGQNPPGQWEQKKRKGNKVSERCNPLSVGKLDGIVSRLLGKSHTLLIIY
jgi:hypothetical protein